MCNLGYFLSYMDGLGTSYARSFRASTNARFYKELFPQDCLGSQIFIKGMCPAYIFQATNEVMYLSWSLIKRQNTLFCNTFILKFERIYLPEMRVEMT